MDDLAFRLIVISLAVVQLGLNCAALAFIIEARCLAEETRFLAQRLVNDGRCK